MAAPLRKGQPILLLVILFLACAATLLYPQIHGYRELANEADKKALVRDLKRLFSHYDWAPTLRILEECDRYYSVGTRFAGIQVHLPPHEKAFLIRFCENSALTVNGASVEEKTIGVLGISQLTGRLHHSPDTSDILAYSPTNGTGSPGDLLIVLREEIREEGFIGIAVEREPEAVQ